MSPTYEYNCETCGVIELEQRISEEPLDSCPTCGKIVERLISRPHVVFRGGGWSAPYTGTHGKNTKGSDDGI